MPYTPNSWVDGPAGNTPITAAQLAHIETQYTSAKSDAAVYTDTSLLGYVGQSAAGIVVPSGATFSQIQSALSSAATFGTRVSAAGTITTSSTLLITSSCDLSGLTINYTGSGVAIQVGSGSGSILLYKTIVLPSVLNTNKTITGWSQVSGSVGVRVTSAFGCTVTIPRIRNFETSLMVRGEAAGCQYNTLILGAINNGFYGVSFTNDSTGWTNQNTFIGGVATMDSAEGNAVSGSRAVLMNTATNLPNTNTFVGTSFEGNCWEYMIEMYGQYNTFLNCRFEASLGAKVYWRASATRNAILQGYGNITPTYETGAVRNSIEQTGVRRNLTVSGTSGVFNLQNDTSGGNAALTVLDPAFAVELGNDPATAYSWCMSSLLIKGKRGGDSFDRIQVDSFNGRIMFGDGTGTPTASFGFDSAALLKITSASLFPASDNTQDLGINATRWRHVRARTSLITGAFATGSRPATSIGAGAMVFDTTLNKPIWSDGTNWRDATGTIV